MIIKTKTIAITVCLASLSACSTFNTDTYNSNYSNYRNQPALQLYPEGYENTQVYAATATEKKAVVVPESYHVGTYQAPASFKDRDISWVSSQNPQGYTIELADGEQAAEVAGALQKAPKNERMAEVKYQNQGKAYYKGVYGSYPSFDAAQQALNSLPEDVKKSAGVKTWGSVQSSVTQ
ncbi:MAG: SPOR domain-containing protein [Legionellaceae bacterium]